MEFSSDKSFRKDVPALRLSVPLDAHRSYLVVSTFVNWADAEGPEDPLRLVCPVCRSL
jgi:hypothetical protein